MGPGPLTLLYPRFIPGTHGPYGDIANLAGLRIVSDAGRPVDWRRDVVDPYAFHLDVPTGTTALRLRFEYVSTPRGGAIGLATRLDRQGARVREERRGLGRADGHERPADFAYSLGLSVYGALATARSTTCCGTARHSRPASRPVKR